MRRHMLSAIRPGMNPWWRILTGGDDGRTLRNLGWLFAEKGLRLAVSFLVTAWVARHLGPGDFGLLSYCAAVVGLLVFLPGLGLDAIVKRDLLRMPSNTAVILGTTSKLRLIAAIATGGVLVGLMQWETMSDPREKWLLAVLSLMLLQPVLFVPELHFQATAAARYVTWAQSIAVLFAAALRVVFIWCNAPLVWFAIAIVAEMMIGGAALAGFARACKVRWWWAPGGMEIARRLLREGWTLLLAGAAVTIYMRIDQVMLRQLAGDAEVGVYSAAVRISEAVYFVPVILVTGLLPRWAAMRDAGGPEYNQMLQGVYDLQALAAYAFAIPISLGAPWLIEFFFGAEYQRAAAVLALHVWAALFVFLGVVRSQEWVFENLNQLTLWTTVAGAVINVALNWWLIPLFGAVGAAGATVIAYAVAAWVSSFCFRSTRSTGVRQTKAMLSLFTCWRYLSRR